MYVAHFRTSVYCSVHSVIVHSVFFQTYGRFIFISLLTVTHFQSKILICSLNSVLLLAQLTIVVALDCIHIWVELMY